MTRFGGQKQNLNVMISFFKRMQATPQRILMLDYDGTIAPFRIERQEATPYPGVRELLVRILSAGHTRLVLVSGRRAHEVLALLDLPVPVEVWGSHGWEHFDAYGGWKTYKVDDETLRRLDRINEFLDAAGLTPHVERKVAGLALHWRGMPTVEYARLNTLMRKLWSRFAAGAALELLPFDGGVEVRAQGRHKGVVVHSILSALPPNSAAAYLGDDATDEDAFAALREQDLSILVRDEYRPTAAQTWLRPPRELLDFLDRWHRAASRFQCGSAFARNEYMRLWA